MTINHIPEQLLRDEAGKFFLHTPAETSKRFVDYVEWTNTGRKLDYGCILDQFLTPPLPGDYISVMARPGHKKTAFMLSLAKRYAQQIATDGANEVVIYATWDEAIENIESYLHAGYSGFDAGDVAWGKVTKEQAIAAGIKRVPLMSPLWVWGTSIMDNAKSKPPFTIDWLFNTVLSLRHDYSLSVKALFLDYLQIIPVLNERDRTAAVTAASKGAKSLAKEIGCPVFAGVQASREVEKKSNKVPGWADAQHASAIEQDSTKQLALSTPIKYLDEGAMIEIGGNGYEVTNDLAICRILKQRGAAGYGTVGLFIDPVVLQISDAGLYGITRTELK